MVDQPTASSRAARNGLAAAGIFLCFFGWYLGTTSRERPWTEAKSTYQVAESLVKQHDVHVDMPWPPGSPRGRDGRLHATSNLLPSLIQVPGVILHQTISAAWPRATDRSLVLTSHLAPAALGGLTCVLLFLLCRRQRLSFAAASLTTLICGLGTSIWVYARYPYPEILEAAAFTGFVLALLEVPSARRPGLAALVAGLVGSALLNCKLVHLLSVGAGGGLLAWWLRHDRRRLLEVASWMAAGLVPGLLMAGLYNWVRWGSPLRSGAEALFARGGTLVGLGRLFLSPGTSVFLYSPPLILALLGVGVAWRRHRSAMALIALATAPVIAVSAAYGSWTSGWNWGPRQLVFALPVFLFPLGVLLDRLREAGRRPLLAAVFAAALVTGGFVQVLGNAFYWDAYIRIAQEARLRWLGAPDRRGAVPPDQGAGCHSCFEDMYALSWLPPFQPIGGHLWLLRHVLRDHDWVRAEQDAAWHRYTKLTLDIRDSYRYARVDWWALDHGDAPGVRVKLLAAMLLLVASGIALWGLGPRP
jgi:hypothetical protein